MVRASYKHINLAILSPVQASNLEKEYLENNFRPLLHRITDHYIVLDIV